MAKLVIDALRKRDVLYGQKLSATELAELARQYLEMEYPGDAVHFFVESGDRAGLEELKAIALEQGDAFILAACARGASDMVTPADWKALATRARELGKESYAARAEHILRGGEATGPILPEDQETE